MDMIKATIINGKKYFTREDKERLIGNGFLVKIEDMAFYSRKTKKKTYLYNYDKVKAIYDKARRKKNIFIPKYVSDRTHSILKDYSIFNMTEVEIAKKYKVTRQAINEIINRYIDPAKDKYEYLIEE